MQPEKPNQGPKNMADIAAGHVDQTSNLTPAKVRRLTKEISDLKALKQYGQINQIQIINFELGKRAIFAIAGPIDSPYQGYWLLVEIQYRELYPYRPPKMRFLDKVWHPFVDFEKGYICMDILNTQFSPAINTQKLLYSVMSLLAETKLNQQECLNLEAAKEMKLNQSYFFKKARECAQVNHYKKENIYQDSQRGLPQEHEIIVEQKDLQQAMKSDVIQQSIKQKNYQQMNMKLQEQWEKDVKEAQQYFKKYGIKKKILNLKAG